LRSAVERAKKQTGKLFVCAPTKGIKLAAAGDEQLAVATDSMQRVKRKLRRTTQDIGRIEQDKLDHQQRVRLHTSASIIGAMLHFTANRSVNKIEQAVAQSSGRLPIEDTLKIFERKNGNGTS
jgi:hypothetical protein